MRYSRSAPTPVYPTDPKNRPDQWTSRRRGSSAPPPPTHPTADYTPSTAGRRWSGDQPYRSARALYSMNIGLRGWGRRIHLLPTTQHVARYAGRLGPHALSLCAGVFSPFRKSTMGGAARPTRKALRIPADRVAISPKRRPVRKETGRPAACGANTRSLLRLRWSVEAPRPFRVGFRMAFIPYISEGALILYVLARSVRWRLRWFPRSCTGPVLLVRVGRFW